MIFEEIVSQTLGSFEEQNKVFKHSGNIINYWILIIINAHYNCIINELYNTDEKGPYILQTEAKKAIKEMRNIKATGNDDVPGDVLKLLKESGLKMLTKLINTIYEPGEWPKDFTEVTMIVLKKKTHAKKCSDHRKSALLYIQQR